MGSAQKELTRVIGQIRRGSEGAQSSSAEMVASCSGSCDLMAATKSGDGASTGLGLTGCFCDLAACAFASVLGDDLPLLLPPRFPLLFDDNELSVPLPLVGF